VPGGDGTEARPYATIAAAIQRAPAGAVIALAAGNYAEALVLTSGLSLFGVCAERTTLASPDRAHATLHVVGADTTVHSLTVSGLHTGIEIDSGGGATLDGVVIRGATGRGVHVHDSGTATASRVIVRDTQVDPSDPVDAGGYGWVLEHKAFSRISAALFERNHVVSLFGDGFGARFSLTDSLIRDSLVDTSTGALGYGCQVQKGARGEIMRSVIERSHFAGASVQDGASSIRISESVVRATRSDDFYGFGLGVGAFGGGQLTVVRSLLDDNVLSGVGVFGSTSSADLTDVVILRTNNPDARFAHQAGGTLRIYEGRIRATRVHLESNTYAGIIVRTTTSAVLQDITVKKTAGWVNGADGLGLSVRHGATATIARCSFSENHFFGIYVGDNARLRAEDIIIEDTQLDDMMGLAGRGIQVQDHSRLSLARARRERNVGMGFMAAQTSSVSVSDLTILDTRPDGVNGHEGFGVGLVAEDATFASFTRVHVEQSRGWGIYGQNVTLRLKDARATRTLPMARKPFDFAPTFVLGRGIDLEAGTDAHVERSLFDDNLDSAITAGGNGTNVFLRDVVARDTTAGDTEGQGGSAMYVVGGARVFVEGARFERSRQVSVWVYGSSVEMRDVDVVDSWQSACRTESCSMQAGGIGIGSYGSAIVDVDHFLVWRSSLCGVQVASGGQLTLHHGAVVRAAIGANVQDPGYDFTRLSDDVVYVDNDRTLDAAQLTPPAADPTINLH
jgi:hypothetical protein